MGDNGLWRERETQHLRSRRGGRNRSDKLGLSRGARGSSPFHGKIWLGRPVRVWGAAIALTIVMVLMAAQSSR
jgi:hypothetical protein